MFNLYKNLQKEEVEIMSNRLFQGVVHQMKDAIDRMIGVIDEKSTVIACSELTKVGDVHDLKLSNIASGSDAFVKGSFTYKPFGNGQNPEYMIFVEGTDAQAARYASLLGIALSNIKYYYDEKYDRGNFIKNIILDNILPGDIYLKARELHFNSEVYRAVILIRIVSKNEVPIFDIGGAVALP